MGSVLECTHPLVVGQCTLVKSGHLAPKGALRGVFLQTADYSRCSSRARATAWVRLVAASLARTCFTWRLAVLGAITRRTATSRFEAPAANSSSTSVSRALNGSM